jgi:hypothetical protein
VTGVPDGQLFLDTLFSTVNCVHEVKSVKKPYISPTPDRSTIMQGEKVRDIQIG